MIRNQIFDSTIIFSSFFRINIHHMIYMLAPEARPKTSNMG